MHHADVMEEKKSLSDQLEERLIEFAARIVTFSTELGGTPAGKHIAMQMLRSGTAPAPNYAEARGAESRADFIHKLGIVQKELNKRLATNRFENCRGKAGKRCHGSRGKPGSVQDRRRLRAYGKSGHAVRNVGEQSEPLHR